MTRIFKALCFASAACFSTAAFAALPYPTNVNTLIARSDTTIIG